MAKEQVQSYFKDYPGSDQCFETTDGLLFHQEGDANLHQTGTLNSKEPVQKHIRPSIAVKAVETVSEVLIGEAEIAEAVPGEAKKAPKKGK